MKNDEGDVVDLYIPRKWCAAADPLPGYGYVTQQCRGQDRRHCPRCSSRAGLVASAGPCRAPHAVPRMCT